MSTVGEIKTNCPCEKILEEKKCDNLDCIKICNLESVFDSAGQFIKTQCMKGLEKKIFTLKEKQVTKFEGFIDDVKEEIKEIEKKNQKKLTKTCPNCHLSSKVTVQSTPKQKEENCETYMKTNKYKKWKEMISRDKYICSSSGLNVISTKNKLSKEEKKLCKLGKKYNSCCDTKHLGRTYEYSDNMKIELRKGEICGEEEFIDINNYFSNFVGSVIRGSDHEFSKIIYSQRPDGCSFNVSQVSQIDKKNCTGNLVLRVTYVHKSDKSWLIPVYNLSINYEGDIKCL